MKYALNRHGNNFKENIDSLLVPHGALAELRESPRDGKWKDTDLAVAVRRECAGSYERIEQTMERMKRLLDDIQTGVGEIELPSNEDNEVLDLVSYFLSCN